MRRNLLAITVHSMLTALLVCGATIELKAEILQVPEQFETIQAAVDAAKNGDVVELSFGLFRGAGNRDVRLQGKSITIRSAFGPDFTVVDAEGTSQEPYRGFIFDSGETTDTVIEGLTICGGATLPGAIADQFNGGGLFFLNSSATFRNCIIEDNECGCWGAGVYASGDSSPVFIDCSISNNLSGDDGGAVFVWNSAKATLINCNLNNNDGTVTGGAITDFSFQTNEPTRVINCNLVGNRAMFGSAIYGGNIDVVNSIVWANEGSANPVETFSTAIVSYSIVEGGYDGVGNIDVDPSFVDWTADDFRLSPGSPAIDAANNEVIPGDILTDILGNNRFHDDVGKADTGLEGGQSAIADLGPVEFQGRTFYSWTNSRRN